MLYDTAFDLSTDVVNAIRVTDALRVSVEQFLYREARRLDTRAFDDWLGLWTTDGMYWMPHKLDQANPHDHISLFWEDATLRHVRIRRITNPRNWSQQPVTRTARLIGNVMIDGTDDAGRLIVHSTIHVTEWRNGQRELAGLVTHKLVAQDDSGWQIYLKRVDLVNAADVFANLEVFV